jgi:hypothetical protein
MAFTTSRLARSALFLAAVAAVAETASGQSVFDPYQPENSQYYNYTTPSLPINLALPNAAREAGAYQALGNTPPTSRFNSFNRFLDDYDNSGPARVPGSARGRGSLPISTAEQRLIDAETKRSQKFVDAEAKRAQIETDRSILYHKMMREQDPTRKAQIYREIQALSAPRPAASARQSSASARANDTPTPPRGSGSRTTTTPSYGPPPLLARPEPVETPAEALQPRAGRQPAETVRPAPPLEEPAVRSRRPPSAAEVPDQGAGSRQPRSRPTPPSTTTPTVPEPSSPPLPLPDVPAPR